MREIRLLLPGATLTTVHNARSVGYAHSILLANEEACTRAVHAWSEVGCVWSSRQWASQVPHMKYYLDRLSLVARVARLGFNLLMVDSDVLFLEDIYTHLKSPPLRDRQLMALRDPYNGLLNCAIIYIQNARPDGPAVQLMAEVPDRIERWAEGAAALKARDRLPHCWDQMVVSDSLISAVAGRPIAFGCWQYWNNQSQKEEWNSAHVRFFHPNQTGGGFGIQHFMTMSREPWPADLVRSAPGFPPTATSELWTATLRVPNSQGTWPEGLGGHIYPGPRAGNASGWIELIKSDGQPMWPDPEDPAQAAAAAALTERFAFLPDWLGAYWMQRAPAGGAAGNSGYWSGPLLATHAAAAARAGAPLPAGAPPPASPYALVHVFHPPGGGHLKQLGKMAMGHFPWHLMHRLRHDGGLYLASTQHAPVPDVLAYTPGVEGREWASYAEWNEAALALARLALEMGRAAAFPAPRCNVSWLGGGRNNRLPLDITESDDVKQTWIMPYGRPGEGFGSLRCMLGGYLAKGCMHPNWFYPSGLLAPEYDDLVAHVQHNNLGVAVADASLLANAPAAAAAAAASLTSATAGGDGAAAAAAAGAAAAGGGGGGAAVWDVESLAAALMAAHGGLGSGGGTQDVGVKQEHTRPRLLLLPAVPVLSGKSGPRMKVFEDNSKSGDVCNWLLGKPFM
ncbi:hypothetical protein CHLRE_09g412550v5 [Chlamydomonas reinhardtii]|uniref:Nucleotide-diphospho-sugar transferase domain-containing protein n=1 Tax=Chlamydomonas reinhardtii TaxID=3055 RepID=A0A2K3DFS3_CHLRE|nr:uncharacterized protein CHLRE_09g412550v5 [Chlamydomonas reinhardtii]PNW79367.1 hypothetical protein CHLRE_09g412550v5 [Chlamydomonas reinhardtii]